MDMHSAHLKCWSNFAGCVATEKGRNAYYAIRLGKVLRIKGW
jgi:hypothetical protein